MPVVMHYVLVRMYNALDVVVLQKTETSRPWIIFSKNQVQAKKKGLLFIGILCGVLLAVNITALWIVSISSTAEYSIFSDEYGGLVVHQDLSGEIFDSLTGASDIQDYFMFENEAIGSDMNVTIQTQLADVVDDCTNWENDCSYSYSINDTGLDEGTQTIYIPHGNNSIKFHWQCVQYSCPQTIIPSVTVEKIPL